MNMANTTAPVLSTPAEHIFEASTPVAVPSNESRLSDEQLYIQYEIKRTIHEIREGRWKRIALQFPDEMLVDAPRVFELLRDGLRKERKTTVTTPNGKKNHEQDVQAEQLETRIDGTIQPQNGDDDNTVEERLCILGDTSYGACCVDEVAAEHVDAEVVVHYGRSCLSPTTRLPVIYVFTSKQLDIDAAAASFERTYNDFDEKICLIADIQYSNHVSALHEKLHARGYKNLFPTEVVRDPSSALPNRTVPPEVKEDSSELKDYSVFHISSPPTSLLLILSSRVKRITIFPTDVATPNALEASTAQVLRRRYAMVTRLSTVPIFGILINTLSVSNYMAALQHCQDLISRAGKKSYVFVVGKLNAAKLANFSEIGGWVVIGCWESSLVESEDFYRPIITPFELEIALKDDDERLWNGKWIGDFAALLQEETGLASKSPMAADQKEETQPNGVDSEANWDEQSDDEPPDFDLRTGRYVSHARPMGRPKATVESATPTTESSVSRPAPPSSALVQRAKGDVATINGAISPGAEYLRSNRTWQGLGSDYEIAYERDGTGDIRGAAVEEGRSGVAKGYAVGEKKDKS